MKATWTWVAGGAFLALTAVSAQADCAAELARLTEGSAAHEGISKDGSLAPLEQPGDAAQASDSAMATDAAATDTAASTGGDGIAKDGSHVPLEGAEGQQTGVAMSGADAAAQQEGQPTAAEQAAGAGSDAAMDQSARDAHIQAARDALAAGDEDACMAAVQAAQS